MSFVRSVMVCLWKAIDFSGRAPRSEFWGYMLFWSLSCFAAGILIGAQGATLSVAGHLAAIPAARLLVLLVPVLLLAPLPALAVRRLHDVDVSGWWLLSAAVPVPVLDLVVVGAQVFCFARPGTVGENRYGPDPKTESRDLHCELSAG